MDADKKRLFLMFSLNVAIRGKLNLTNDQLRCLFRECLEIARDLGVDVHMWWFAYTALGDINMKLSRFHEAIECFQNLLQLSKYLGEKEADTHLCVSLAACWEFLGQHDNCLQYSETGLRIAKQNGDKAGEWSACGMLGACYFSLEQYDKAIHHYKLSLNIAKQIGSKDSERKDHRSLGNCYRSMEQYAKAVHHYEISLNIAKEIGNKDGEGDVNYSLGSCHYSLGQYEKAIHHYIVSLNTAKHIGNKEYEGNIYDNLGNCYHCLGQNKKAIQYHDMSLNIAYQNGNKADQKRACDNLGSCYHSLRHNDKAVHYYEISLNIAKQIGNREGEGKVYCCLGNCLVSLGQYGEAIHHYELSLNIAKQIGNKQDEVFAYGYFGVCFRSLGQYDKAKHCHEMSLNIAKQIGDKNGEREAYDNLGVCYRSLGQYDKAMHCHEESLNIAKQIGDKKSEGHIYGNLGCCFGSLAQYEKAKNYQEKSLNIAKRTGDKEGEQAAYGNLGNCYRSLGQDEKAITFYEMSLKIAKEIGDKRFEGKVYVNLSSCYQFLGQHDKAIHYHEMSLDVAKQIGNKKVEGQVYDNLGCCGDSSGQYDKAIHHHEMKLNIAKQVSDKEVEGLAYFNLGSCYYDHGQYVEAVQHYQISLNIAKQNGDKALQGNAYHKIGVCYFNSGQYSIAESSLMKSIHIFEGIFRSAPKKDIFKVSIRETFITTYALLTRVLLCQLKDNAALAIAERGRSRALVELMLSNYSTQSTEIKALDFYDICDVVKAIDSLVLFFFLDVDSINIWIIQPNGNIVLKKERLSNSVQTKNGALVDQVKAVEAQINLLINRAFDTHGVACTATSEDRPLSCFYGSEETEQSKAEVTAAHKMETFPVYLSSSAAAQSGETMVKKPIPVRPEHRNIEEERKRPEEFPKNNLRRKLYKMLLAPVRQFVEGSRVVIVADGVLNLVPFAALIDEEERYLAESLQVRLVPSLATAKMIMERPQEQGCESSPLIVGDPDVSILKVQRLPGAFDEAEMIAQLFGVQPLTEKDATKEKVLQHLESANLVHIAAHGDMKRGEICLAPKSDVDIKQVKKEDFMLLMSDLEQKRLKARLVVLSCCNSARGEVRAEGVIGIARAFLGAGACAVLVSLWKIDDEATLFFMREFYGHFSRGEKANEALDKAMKATRDTAKFADPLYWAPFVLIGDNVSLF